MSSMREYSSGVIPWDLMTAGVICIGANSIRYGRHTSSGPFVLVNMNENILILGGGYAGVMAAARIARRGTPVTLIDARDGMVERIRLHQVAAGDDIPPVAYKQLFRNLPVNVVRARVTSI